MKNKILTGLQIALVAVWAVASYTIDDTGLNLFVFNILPIPNFGLVIVSFGLLFIGYWLQRLKDEGKSDSYTGKGKIQTSKLSTVVLVCMDDFINDLLKDKFNKAGIDLITFNQTDNTFVDQMADIKPDLILMGIIVPSINGYDLTEILKNDQRTKEIKIVGYTNVSDDENRKRGMDLGMQDYWLMADCTPTELVQKVIQFIDKKKFMFCEKCGKQVIGNPNFCKFCGNKLI